MTDNSLVRTQLESSLELSSLKSLAREAEVVMLLIDTSGSMSSPVDRWGAEPKRRIDALREVVAIIKSQGHVPMIAFGGAYGEDVRFVDDVPEPAGGTPLHLAIPLAKQFGATRLVVVSDGMPDLTQQSMDEARMFGGRIDVAFVGTVGEGGDLFLNELARATGGTQFNGSLGDPKQLSSGIIGLLEGEVPEAKAPLQGAGFATVVSDDDEDDDEDDDTDDDEEEDDDEDEDDEDEDR